MGFHKHTFPIFNIEKAASRIKIVSGWKDDNGLGYNKAENNRWICTDLMSGARVCDGRTRKECSEWAEKNMIRILRRRNEESYIEIVMEFKHYLEMEMEMEKNG